MTKDKTKWAYLDQLPSHAEILQQRAFHLNPTTHPDHATGEATWYGADDGRLMLCYGDEGGGYVWVIAHDAPDAAIHLLDDVAGQVQ